MSSSGGGAGGGQPPPFVPSTNSYSSTLGGGPGSANVLVDALRECEDVQFMIDKSSSHLERLRAPTSIRGDKKRELDGKG